MRNNLISEIMVTSRRQRRVEAAHIQIRPRAKWDGFFYEDFSKVYQGDSLQDFQAML